jgi:hypothetical protein
MMTIRQKLIIKDQVVPGRFRFTVPETGYKIKDELSMNGLLARVKKHYEDNNIPLPNEWEASVEDQICRQLPEGWCEYSDGQPAKGAKSLLSAESIIKGITSLATMATESVSGGDVFVNQSEATRRAEICARCYQNMTTNFCAGCGVMQKITSMVAKVKGKRTTPLDSKLYTCGVCGCRNEAIVHVNRNILLSGEKSETTNSRPDWCWLKNDDLNQASQALHI